ncbi:MAG: serine hydrolase [Deltaproteobacteria bacterium]|nr:serine hydrolase [Deltaproteobacteria bacterium]
MDVRNEVNISRGAAFSILAAVAVFLALTAAVSAAATAVRYDVSYFWSGSFEGVQAYRDRVADALGPEAARGLRVVGKGDLFGLVYEHPGGRSGALLVAEEHSRLLQSRGLEAAMAVPAQDWELIEDGWASETSFPPSGASEVSGDVSKETEQDRGIPDLQASIEDYINRLRREGRIKDDERTAWSVYDFTSGEKLVSINEDEPFAAASMVKVFIAAAFFHKVARGDLIYGNNSRRHMRLSIQYSSNESTNWLLRKIGGPKSAQHILKRNYPGIFQDTRIVEYIPRGGRTYRNEASPHDYSRFLHAVWNGDIPGAREIKRLMGLPSANRIRTGITGIPESTRVYNKTGSTARVCGDLGILVARGQDGKRYPYTVIGIIEKERRARNYTDWIRSRGDVIRNVSGIIYRGIATRHDL